jgi:excisionase family DNA binding protein
MAVNDVSEPRARSAESWRAESVCRKHPTRWWFGGDHRETVLAKRICAGCAVQAPCLEFALGRPELLGVWAATTPTERVAMRRTGGAPVEIPVESAAEVEEAHIDEEQDKDVDIDIDLVLEGDRDREHDRELGLEREPVARPRSSRARPSRLADGDELLTPAEAARRLGVTANTVTRWSRDGKIAAVQTVGGHRRFRSSEIERVLLAANVIAPASI